MFIPISAMLFFTETVFGGLGLGTLVLTTRLVNIGLCLSVQHSVRERHDA